MAMRRLLMTMIAAVLWLLFAAPSGFAGSNKQCGAGGVAVSVSVSYVDSGPHRVDVYQRSPLRRPYCTAPPFYYSAGIAHRFPRFYFNGPPHRGYGYWKKSHARRY